MATFNPSMIKAASASKEFANTAKAVRDPKITVIESIEKQLELFQDPKANGNRWFASGEKEIALTIRYSNRALKLMGDETRVVVPHDQFEAAMDYYKGEVAKGVFDDQLAEISKMIEAKAVKMRATRAANKA